jgi:hypothetical protein
LVRLNRRGKMHAPTVGGGGGRRGIGGEENQIEWGHHPPGEMQLQAAAARIGHEEACVGRLQVQTAQHATVQVGFMCGSLPVPTETPSTITSSCTPFSPSRTALVPALNLLSQRYMSLSLFSPLSLSLSRLRGILSHNYKFECFNCCGLCVCTER